MIIKKIFHNLLSHSCIFCYQKTRRSLDLCQQCEQDLPKLQHTCRYCALPIAREIDICAHCLKNKPTYDQAFIPYSYEGLIIPLIQGLKFHHKLVYANLLSQLLISFLEQKFVDHQKPDCIIPIPLHLKRLRERGFNQALELAKPIAKRFQIPIDIKHFERIKHTTAQTTLHKKDRNKNIKNAFGIKSAKASIPHHVWVLDDVMTTGSTVHEFSRLLKKLGVKKIDICCVARTIGDAVFLRSSEQSTLNYP